MLPRRKIRFRQGLETLLGVQTDSGHPRTDASAATKRIPDFAI
jgi:hypothetical protein